MNLLAPSRRSAGQHGRTTTATALILDGILMTGVIGALAAVVRLSLRGPHGERLEATGTAGQIPARRAADEERVLAHAA